MNQRELILEAWEKHKATRAPSPHLRMAQEFFDYVESHRDICWTELSEKFREKYYEAFDEIIPVLMATDDPFIVHNLVRFADLANPKEAEAAKKLVRTADPDRHEVTMVKLAGTDETLRSAIKKKSKLPDSVKAAIAAQEEK
ncbi:MAG TPA: hypothetical protein VGJ37_11305 [Pyrinomonadaceae bacterium]|jgi:hypothetical protein